jgi:hypothetical protein
MGSRPPPGKVPEELAASLDGGARSRGHRIGGIAISFFL